jgi:flagellar hook-associated protein 1
MSLSVALHNAVSGLHLNQRALDVTSQNVANVNTDGYSRKTVNQEAVVIAGQGAGVQISSITRTVNEFMLKDLRVQISAMAEFDEQNEFYGRMQDLFGSPGSGSSVGVAIADLETRMQALSVIPENYSLMTEITSRAELIALQFNQISEEIESLRLEADTNIGNAITTVNTQLDRIQELNLRIAENLALGRGASELQDQRDIALSEVASMIDINYFERSNGEIVIFTDSGRPLLDRTVQPLSHTPASSFGPTTTWASGAVSPITLGGNDITSEIDSGAVAGWIAMRDTILPDLHSQFEELAQSFTHEINALHNDGVGFPGRAQMTGTREVAATDTPTWSGQLRIGILDPAGTVVEFQDFDLATYPTTGDLITAINAMTNVTAVINAAGNVELDAIGTSVIAMNELTSAVTVGNTTMGASAFLGMNDLFRV